MKFSVLLSVYHKEKPECLSYAIESTITQSLKPNEIVIIKDGPLTQELDDIINSFSIKNPKLFKIYSLKYNQGLGNALRFGVQKCQFDFIARMDSDDISLPDRFEKQIQYLKQHPEISVLGGYIEEFSKSVDNITGIRKIPLKHYNIYKYGKNRNPMNHVTIMMRKKDVINSGNYQPFLFQEDYYLWARMILKGYIFGNLSEVLVKVRGGEDMQKRRGGLKYLSNEIKFHNQLRRIHFTNSFDFIKNSFIRVVFRLSGKKIRTLLYKHKLRD